MLTKRMSDSVSGSMGLPDKWSLV